MFESVDQVTEAVTDLVRIATKREDRDPLFVDEDAYLGDLVSNVHDLLVDAEETFGIDLDLEKENFFRTGGPQTVEDLQKLIMRKFRAVA